MSVDDDVEILRQIPVFSDIPAGKLKLMAFAAERVSFPKGHELFRQGDQGDVAYVVLSGNTDVFIETPNGPQKIVTDQHNAIVGEIAMLIDVPRTATVVATSDLVCLKLTKALFFQLVAELPKVAVEIIRVLAQHAQHTAIARGEPIEALEPEG